MSNNKEIEARINKLEEQCNEIQSSLRELRKELSSEEAYKQAPIIEPLAETTTKVAPPPIPESYNTSNVTAKENIARILATNPKKVDKQKNKKTFSESFIGQNILSIIGIVILILGVGLGIGHLAEKQLSTPFARIMLAYGLSLTLIVIGVFVKKKYKHFSAILISGALAIGYYTTFIAYDNYSFINWWQALLILLTITIGIVYTSLKYNNEIIAIIGQVGAYAIPFILQHFDNYIIDILLYVVIINMGILFLSKYKKWQTLHILAFIFSWITFSVYSIDTHTHNEIVLCLCITIINFLQFYAMPIISNLKSEKPISKPNIALLICNAIIFFRAATELLKGLDVSEHSMALFAAVYSLFHGLVFLWASKRKTKDKHLIDITLIFSIVSLAMVLPNWFNFSSLGAAWAIMAASLITIGHLHENTIFKQIGYLQSFLSILMFFKVILFNDLPNGEVFFDQLTINGLLYILAFGVINWVYFNKTFTRSDKSNFANTLSYIYPIILITISYLIGCIKIDLHMNFYLNDLYSYNAYYQSILEMNNIFISVYSIVFTSILAIINLNWIKRKILGNASTILCLVASMFFLTSGLYHLSELRDIYIETEEVSFTNLLLIRYLAILILSLTLAIINTSSKAFISDNDFKTFIKIFIAIAILWVLNSELLNWLALNGHTRQYGIAISILCGVYGLSLVVWGIIKDVKAIRYVGIVLFGLIIFKIFIYDASALSALGRIIVYITTGVILLLSSFIYTKYKKLIK